AYTRQYEPTWAAPKFEYIHGRVFEYNYQINLKKPFKFSLCGWYHNILLKLNPNKTKEKSTEKAIDKMTDLEIISDKAIDKTTDKAPDVVINEATDLVMDMRMDSISETISEINEIFSSPSPSVIFDEDEAIISNDDTELEIGYKLIIKTAEG
ncbi:28560_t:CDS:2, partial [Racocetra persica]